MKTLGALLLLVATMFALEPSKPPRIPAPRPQMACTPALRPQMAADDVVAFQLKDGAYTLGLEKGIGLGAGGMLLLVGIGMTIWRGKQPEHAASKPLSRAASA